MINSTRSTTAYITFSSNVDPSNMDRLLWAAQGFLSEVRTDHDPNAAMSIQFNDSRDIEVSEDTPPSEF